MAAPAVTTPIPDQNVSVGQNVSLDISDNITDADAGDSLNWTVDGLPVGTGFSMDPNSGILSGNPGAADVSASPIAITIRATDEAGEDIAFASTIELQGAANPEPPDFIVRKDGTGNFTTLQAALDSVVAVSTIIELQGADPAVKEYFQGSCKPTFSGTNGNEIIVRARAGDSVIIYNPGGRCIELDGVSYLIFKNLQIGREAEPAIEGGSGLNGWRYDDAGSNVEHNRCIDAKNGTKNIKFENCTEYGGSFYDSSNVTSTCSEFWFLRHTFKYAGANANKPGDPSNDRSNCITFSGHNSVFELCKGDHGGHGIVANQGNFNAFINCDWDAYWGDENSGSGFDGSRTHANALEKGIAPFGPFLMDGCLLRNSKATPEAPFQPALKIHGYRGIVRRTMIYDGIGEAFHLSPLNDKANVAQAICIYNNTVYIQDSFIDMNDRTNTTIGLGGALIKNNLAQALAQSNDQAIKKIVDTIGPGPHPDGWRLDWIDKSILRDAAAGTVNVRLNDGVTNQTKSLADSETDFPVVLTNNLDAAITFPNIGDRTSTDLATAKNAFEPTTAAALGTAEPMALATDAGTGTTATLDNSNWIYTATAWGHDWMGRPDDYIKHVPAGLDPTTNGTILQVTANNRDTGVITFTPSITRAIGDEFYPVEHDGVTLTDNVGAWQKTET